MSYETDKYRLQTCFIDILNSDDSVMTSDTVMESPPSSIITPKIRPQQYSAKSCSAQKRKSSNAKKNR